MNWKLWERRPKPVKINASDMARDGMIVNMMRRIQGYIFGQSPDGKRDYNALFGYGETLSYSDFYGMYARGGIANTVIEKVAKACWRDVPVIKAGDSEILTDDLSDLKSAGLFAGLERADILNRIGNYSVLLIGVPDGMKLDQPVGSANSMDGMYFQAYSQAGITVTQWDNEPTSPRYGKPVMYQLQVISQSSTQAQQIVSRNVHHSRIVLMAEGALESDFDGRSALEPCWNALIDKDKARGSAAEAYFRNARQKFTLEAVTDANVSNDSASLSALKNEVLAFTNDQQDFMRLQNMKANVIQPEMVSPRDVFDVAVEEVAGVTGIPIRVLTGKGGGNLAGSEDKSAWNAVIGDRQSSVCTDYLTQALRILEEAGLVKLPKSFVIEWPASPVMNDLEAADEMVKRADAATKIGSLATAMGEVADVNGILESVGLDPITVEKSNQDDELDA